MMDDSQACSSVKCFWYSNVWFSYIDNWKSCKNYIKSFVYVDSQMRWIGLFKKQSYSRQACTIRGLKIYYTRNLNQKRSLDVGLTFTN